MCKINKGVKVYCNMNQTHAKHVADEIIKNGILGFINIYNSKQVKLSKSLKNNFLVQLFKSIMCSCYDIEIHMVKRIK